MSEENVELKAQGLFDVFKLADRDLIEKVLAVAKAGNVQHLEGGIVRISVDIKLPD